MRHNLSSHWHFEVAGAKLKCSWCRAPGGNMLEFAKWPHMLPSFIPLLYLFRYISRHKKGIQRVVGTNCNRMVVAIIPKMSHLCLWINCFFHFWAIKMQKYLQVRLVRLLMLISNNMWRLSIFCNFLKAKGTKGQTFLFPPNTSKKLTTCRVRKFYVDW